MITEVRMPKLDFDMEEGTVIRWLVENGTVVQEGDGIAEIETHKMVAKLSASAAGLLNIQVPVGEAVPVGTVIAVIDGGGVG